ncbi:putative conserved membrane protein [Synechococcus sp. PROS-U-1]|nr:putative conserved membrane protein [Synechococcus sp. PROS-U-1]
MASDAFLPSGDDAIASSETDEPFSRHASVTAITGLLIAVVSFSAPVVVVITDRTFPSPRLIPTASARNGSPSAPPVSFARIGESHRGDTGGKPK